MAYTAHFNLNSLAGASAQFSVAANSVGFDAVSSVSGDVQCWQTCQDDAQHSDMGSAQCTIAIHYDGIRANSADGLGDMAAHGTFSGVLMAPTNDDGLGMGFASWLRAPAAVAVTQAPRGRSSTHALRCCPASWPRTRALASRSWPGWAISPA